MTEKVLNVWITEHELVGEPQKCYTEHGMLTVENDYNRRPLQVAFHPKVDGPSEYQQTDHPVIIKRNVIGRAKGRLLAEEWHAKEFPNGK